METKNSTPNNEVSLKLFTNAVKRFWIVMLITTVLFCAIGGAYTYLFTTEVHKATASFWVKGSGTGTSNSAIMAQNYSELVDTDGLLRRAVNNTDGISVGGPLNEQWGCTADEAVRRLRAVISSSKSSEATCIFTITATSSDKEVAYQSIDAVQYAISGYISEELDPDGNFPIQLLNQIHSIEDVSTVPRPILKNTVIFGAVGAIMSFCVCALIAFYRPERAKAERSEDSLTKEEQ